MPSFSEIENRLFQSLGVSNNSKKSTDIIYKIYRRDLRHLRKAIVDHIEVWSDMEGALSGVLVQFLRSESELQYSRVAHAIYFSLPGFEARKIMVNEALEQFIYENPQLNALLPLWKKTLREMNKSLSVRNKIAHGAPFGMEIEGKTHVRIGPPLEDVNRIHRLMVKGTVPGLSIDEVRQSIKNIKRVIKLLTAVIKVLHGFCNQGPDTMKRTLPLLKQRLRGVCVRIPTKSEDTKDSFPSR